MGKIELKKTRLNYVASKPSWGMMIAMIVEEVNELKIFNRDVTKKSIRHIIRNNFIIKNHNYCPKYYQIDIIENELTMMRDFLNGDIPDNLQKLQSDNIFSNIIDLLQCGKYVVDKEDLSGNEITMALNENNNLMIDEIIAGLSRNNIPSEKLEKILDSKRKHAYRVFQIYERDFTDSFHSYAVLLRLCFHNKRQMTKEMRKFGFYIRYLYNFYLTTVPRKENISE